jgi:hypothetical protein
MKTTKLETKVPRRLNDSIKMQDISIPPLP